MAFRGLLIASLVALGVASLVNLPPPALVNRSAPSPASDTVVFLHVDATGASLRTLTGVSARDGATRWTRTLDAQIDTTPLQPQPGLLLAHTAAGSVYALRMSDGAPLWTYQMDADATPTLVAADGTRAYVLTHISSPVAPTAAWDALALDLRTGALLWRTYLALSAAYPPQLVVGDGLVAVAENVLENGVYSWRVQALRATDGALQWKVASATVVPRLPHESLTAYALLIAQGNVFVVPDIGPLAVLRGRDGAVAWSATNETLGQASDTTPRISAIVTDGAAVYVLAHPTGAPTGADVAQTTLTALAARSGAVRWRIRPPTSAVLPPIFNSGPALAVSDGVLLSGQNVTSTPPPGGYYPQGSLLTAYDAATGKALWRDNTPPTGVSWDLSSAITPQGASGVVYLEGIQSDPFVQDRFNCLILCPGVTWLYAVNVRTGAAWWRTRTGYAILRHLFVF